MYQTKDVRDNCPPFIEADDNELARRILQAGKIPPIEVHRGSFVVVHVSGLEKMLSRLRQVTKVI